MPKLIDYAARFDCIREAVFEITLRGGAQAINLPAVAAEMQTSVSSVRRTLRTADALPRLGLQWVETRQRQRVSYRWSGELRGSDRTQRAVNTLLRMVPSTDRMADEARVWRTLVWTHAHEHAWAREAREERERGLAAACLHIVSVLDLDENDERYEIDRLRAVVDGATARICTGHLTPDDGATLVRRHLLDLLGDRVAMSDDAA